MENVLKKKLLVASIILDKLQVELCDDTPYEIPTAEECRARILSAMDYLETVTELCEKIYQTNNHKNK